MKKNIFLICALIVLTSSAFSQNIDLGFGATSGAKMKFDNTGTTTMGYGLNARVVVGISKFGISGGVSYYLPSTYEITGSKIKNTYYSINADLHYYLIKIPKIRIYALAGLANNTLSSKTTIAGNSTKTTKSNLLFEIGTGLKAGPLFVEVKYQTKIKQFVTTIGFSII